MASVGNGPLPGPVVPSAAGKEAIATAAQHDVHGGQ